MKNLGGNNTLKIDYFWREREGMMVVLRGVLAIICNIPFLEKKDSEAKSAKC